jgi:hypothetical protein
MTMMFLRVLSETKIARGKCNVSFQDTSHERRRLEQRHLCDATMILRGIYVMQDTLSGYLP